MDVKTVQAWRAFLATTEGELGLLYLKSQTPIPSASSSESEMVFQAGVVNGYFKALHTELEMFLKNSDEPIIEEQSDRLEPNFHA
jgi:hypothetical protein